jgi:hypothetical protein
VGGPSLPFDYDSNIDGGKPQTKGLGQRILEPEVQLQREAIVAPNRVRIWRGP